MHHRFARQQPTALTVADTAAIKDLANHLQLLAQQRPHDVITGPRSNQVSNQHRALLPHPVSPILCLGNAHTSHRCGRLVAIDRLDDTNDVCYSTHDEATTFMTGSAALGSLQCSVNSARGMLALLQILPRGCAVVVSIKDEEG